MIEIGKEKENEYKKGTDDRTRRHDHSRSDESLIRWALLFLIKKFFNPPLLYSW